MIRIPTEIIRAVGNTIQMTRSDTKHLNLAEEDIIEWIKCRNNPLYYLYHYVKFEIIGGISSYKELDNFHPKLKRFIRAIFRYHKGTLMASRQLGKSTVDAGLIDWSSRFFPRNKAIILNFQKRAALENLQKINFINDQLPDFLRLEKTSKSDIKTYIDYSNGSKVNVLFPSTIFNKSTIARSLTSPVLYIDESAFITDMGEVFGSAQQVLSKAREQAKLNGYPYFIAISSTPNGIEGSGSWFFNRWTNGIESDLLFEKDLKSPKNENWVENADLIASDPSKNGFINVRYHWSEDPTKNQEWYQNQCRELSDQRKVNQELDLIFVGSSNCIFDDDLLSQFKAQEKVELVSCPHETSLVVYENNLSQNDYYLIGVDTARSLGGAYNSIEIFSFAKFNQIAEFNFRLGSFTKYGQIIEFIFRWLQRQVGNNIILAIENNTIGLTI